MKYILLILLALGSCGYISRQDVIISGTQATGTLPVVDLPEEWKAIGDTSEVLLIGRLSGDTLTLSFKKITI